MLSRGQPLRLSGSPGRRSVTTCRHRSPGSKRHNGRCGQSSRDGKWQIVAWQVLRYYEDPAAGKVDASKYDDYAGTYELAPGNTLTVYRQGNQLFAKRGERAPEELLPEASDIFFRKGVEGRRLFRRGDDGKVDALIDRRNNEDVIFKKK